MSCQRSQSPSQERGKMNLSIPILEFPGRMEKLKHRMWRCHMSESLDGSLEIVINNYGHPRQLHDNMSRLLMFGLRYFRLEVNFVPLQLSGLGLQRFRNSLVVIAFSVSALPRHNVCKLVDSSCTGQTARFKGMFQGHSFCICMIF